jgi:hypothetical protein
MSQKPYSKAMYSGKMQEYQISPERVINYEKDEFSQYQNFLYHRAIYGLKVYEETELKVMSKQKKSRIFKVHKRAQQVINLMKHEVVMVRTNRLFTVLFPKSSLVEELLAEQEPSLEVVNTSSFKDLNISKKDLVERFIKERILPPNFYQLEQDPNFLPRLKACES